MRVRLAALLVGLSLAIPGGASADKSRFSADYILQACRDSINPDSDRDMFRQGLCSGYIQALMAVFQNGSICAPDDANNIQSTMIVLAYLDRQPARLHETFLKLALEAMVAAWPCPRR